MPRKFNAFLEEILLGLAQTKMLTLLSEAARENEVKLGIYYSSLRPEDTAEDTAEGAYAYTYIHSKIMVVDDEFLTIGSANASNRSMSHDTELNVTWEAERRGHRTPGGDKTGTDGPPGRTCRDKSNPGGCETLR